MSAKPPQRARRKPSPDDQPVAPQYKTKKDKLIAMLRRKGGQDMAQLTTALGWLPHTVRAALTGLRKNGFTVQRDVANDGRSRYWIVPETGR